MLSLIPPSDGEAIELATLPDGYTYFSIDGILPDQHAEVTVEDVTPDATLKDQIRDTSPHVAAINRLCREAIRKQYNVDDEIRAIRVGGTTEQAWRDYVQARVDEAEARKVGLGL